MYVYIYNMNNYGVIFVCFKQRHSTLCFVYMFSAQVFNLIP